MIEAPVTRVVLVGFMGAGKSSVGRELAARLGWRLVDQDEAVEAEAGRSVREIFDELGESRFRELEAQVATSLFAQERVVVATGGGWPAHEGRLESLPAGTLSVWLRVGAEEAVRRSRGAGAGRPLLAGPDPLRVARALIAEREPYYARADVGVDTGGSSVEDVTARVLEILADKGTQTTAE